MGIIAIKAAMAVDRQHKELHPIPEWRIQKAAVLNDEKIVFLPLYFAGAFAQFGINDIMELPGK